MKAGWRVVPLGDLCRIELGSTPSRSSVAMWDEKRETSNVWLSIADLPQTLHPFALDSKEYVSDQAAARMRLVPKGTLLVSFKLTLGRLAYSGRDLFTNEAIASLLDLDGGKIDQRFLYWALNQFDWDKASEGDEKVKGKTLNKAKLKVLPIPLPPLDEQKRIVAVLDEAFEGLSRARANAEANLEDAKSLFVAAREDRLAVGYSPHLQLVELSELVDIKHGFAFKSEHFTDQGDFAVLTPGNFLESGGFRRRGHKQRYYSADFPKEYLLKAGDLLVAMTEQAPGLLGSCIIVPNDGHYLHNQRLGLLRPLTGTTWNARFFAHAFNLLSFRQALSDTCSGATVRHTSPGRILSQRIPYCSDPGQLARIVEELDQLDAEVAALLDAYQKDLDNLGSLRQSLLQKAFAGELT